MKKFICVLFALGFNSFYAQSNLFTIKSGSFSDPTVWNTNTVPDSLDNISVSAGDTLVINSFCSVNSVTICSTSVLKADSGATLDVLGNWLNSGKFLSFSSTVRFNGCSPQSVGGNSVTTFYNLECNNNAGVCLSKDQKISNLLTVSQGTLNLSTFKLILLSDTNRTAAIAPLLNGADISGKITVQCYIAGPTTGWRFLGSPVQTKLSDWAADFLTSGFPGSAYPNYYFCSIYKYDETVQGTSDFGYVEPSHANDSLKPGKGFWCWVGPTPDLIDVTGFPKKGDHTFSVSLTPNAGKSHDGWNLVANPYPSAIDWDSEHWTKIGIQNAIYIWDPETEQYTTYANGVGINGGTNVIASSQAFWVQANQNSPVLAATERVKTQEQIVVNRMLPLSAMKLMLSGNSGNDETVIAFRSDASELIETDKDAIKLFTDNPLVPSLTSVCDSTQLAINFLPLSQAAEIPVNVKVGVSGTYTLSGKGFTFPGNRCLFLEDRANGNMINVRDDFSYSFQISDTTSAPRFVLHVTSPLKYTAKSPTCSYKTNGRIKVINTTGACTFSWMDELGNTLATHYSTNGSDSLLNLSAGFYTVKIDNQFQHCPVLAQEVQVGSVAPIKVNALIEGNYCRNSKKGSIQLNEIVGGTGPYTASWFDSQVEGDRFNLPNGVYTVVVSDVNNCSDTSHYAISSISQVQADFSLENDTAALFPHVKVQFTNKSVGFANVKWTSGSQVSYENDPVFFFASAGSHTVILAAQDAQCKSEKEMVLTVKPLDYFLNEAPHIFLSEDAAVIEFGNNGAAVYNVSVYTADGKRLYEGSVESSGGNHSVPLGESRGLYLVTCENKGIITTNKLIK